MNFLAGFLLVTGLCIGYIAVLLAGAVVVSRLIGWGDDR